MKVLDPQSALLTTAEVHQFLKETPTREKDKKVGAYDTVNVVNNHLVRRDVEHYIQLVHPQIQSYSETTKFTRPILVRLKKYNLTKSEVYSLINLGVGLGPSPSPSSSTNTAAAAAAADANGEGAEEDDEEAQESDLNRSLFRLIVEESDDRFPGDEGEQQIDDILGILRECIQGSGDRVNGHAGASGDENIGEVKEEGPR